MPPSFLKKSWSDLMGGKPISVRLSDISHRFNLTKDDESTSCSSPTSSDVSYLSSPPTSPSSSNGGLKISLTNSFSTRKTNSLDMAKLNASMESIESTTSLCVEIPKDRAISNFTKAETPEFSSVKQLIQHYKRLETFCLCVEGKKMLIQSLKEQQKDEQVTFIQLIDNITNNMSSDLDRVTEESLRGICSNICDKFLRDGSECQLNVSNRFIRKFEKDLNNNLTPKEDYLQWIDSIMMDVILQINAETYPSIKKTEEFRVWLLSKALDWASSRDQEDEKEKIEDMSIPQFLEINDLSEYEKLFKKKKLITLADIKHMIDQNDFKDLGVKKLGHQKRLARLVRQAFEHQVKK